MIFFFRLIEYLNTFFKRLWKQTRNRVLELVVCAWHPILNIRRIQKWSKKMLLIITSARSSFKILLNYSEWMLNILDSLAPHKSLQIFFQFFERRQFKMNKKNLYNQKHSLNQTGFVIRVRDSPPWNNSTPVPDSDKKTVLLWILTTSFNLNWPNFITPNLHKSYPATLLAL